MGSPTPAGARPGTADVAAPTTAVPATPATPATAAPAAPAATPATPATPARPGEPPAPALRPTRWRRWATPPADRVTLAELAALGAATGVATIATASLVAAHLGVHSLGMVLGLSAAGVVVLAALARLRAAAFPPVALDPAGLLPAAASGLLALAMFLPGFHYLAGDKDPGGYVMHAFAIARDGSVWVHDRLLAAGDLPVQLVSPGARYPAVWVSDATSGEIFPQFYHLWPALLATSYDVGGYGALVAATPLLGALCVVLTVLVARRVAGVVGAWAAGLLLATNMMEVWQAKYPTTEILSQALFLGALLGVLVAVQTGWRWPALVGGLLVGVGYLGRADGVLIVLLAVAGLAALWVLRRFDARAGWFAVGLAVVLPYGLWQAYGPAGRYTLANDIPGLATMLGLLGACVLGALVLRRPLAGLVDRVTARVEEAGTQRRLGLLATGGMLALFALGVVRPLFGPDYFYYGSRLTRSYDELNLHRLSWFFSWPGLLLLVAGVAVLALRRWSAPAWLVTVPTVGLLVLYAWHARNSPYFMWVGRRFVSTVLPGMVLLIAVALAAIWASRWRGRARVGVPAFALLLAFLAAVQLNQSLPLRSHDEWGGSYGVNRAVAALSGDQRGIYLWAPAKACCVAPQLLFAPTVWLVSDQDSALLPRATPRVAPYVRRYLQTFPDRPVFLVYEAGTAPPPLPGMTTTVSGRFAGTMPHWVESSISRPASARQIPYDFTVYRVR